MPIVSTDLVLYASANDPDTDSGTAGGAIDALRRFDFTQMTSNDSIEAVSSNAGDTTQTLTVEARKANGTVVSETKTLTGTTPVAFSVNATVERVLKAELSATTTGNITVRSTTGPGTNFSRVITASERGFKMLFRKGASDPSVTVNYYTKGFWKNKHGSLALTTAIVKQSADPDSRITHLLATSVDDTNTTTNRITVPGAATTQDPDTFDDTDKTIPGSDLAAGSAIGTWFRLQLPAADAAHRTTYTSQITGNTV